MIHVQPDIGVVIIKGAHRGKDVISAIKEATGRKNVSILDWVIVGLADEVSLSIHSAIQSAMPFSPPEASPVGFKLPGRE